MWPGFNRADAILEPATNPDPLPVMVHQKSVRPALLRRGRRQQLISRTSTAWESGVVGLEVGHEVDQVFDVGYGDGCTSTRRYRHGAVALQSGHVGLECFGDELGVPFRRWLTGGGRRAARN